MDKLEVRSQAVALYKKANTFIMSCVREDVYPLTKAVAPAK